jgi:hypothetical protein
MVANYHTSATMFSSSSVMMTAISISLSVARRPVISQSIQTKEGILADMVTCISLVVVVEVVVVVVVSEEREVVKCL